MRGDERSMIRAVRGPVTLITVGVLFALNNFTEYRFDQTWPVILIVFGLMSLLGRSTERIPPPPPQGFPPAGSYPHGTYSQSSYSQPPGAAKSPNPPGGSQ